jgi:hypothetical protein
VVVGDDSAATHFGDVTCANAGINAQVVKLLVVVTTRVIHRASGTKFTMVANQRQGGNLTGYVLSAAHRGRATHCHLGRLHMRTRCAYLGGQPLQEHANGQFPGSAKCALRTPYPSRSRIALLKDPIWKQSAWFTLVSNWPRSPGRASYGRVKHG